MDGLPDVIAELERSWGIEVGRPLPGGSASWVARAVAADGAPRVVKIGLPAPDPDLAGEAAVLAAAAGRGYAVLHAHDRGRRALLLELLGTSLEHTPMAPERRLRIMAEVLQQAWAVPSTAVSPTGPAQDRAAVLRRQILQADRRLGGVCPPAVLAQAVAALQARRAAYDPDRIVVTHGDPHPANLLRVHTPRPGATTGWAFVDPEGVLAEPAHDLGVALRDWNGRMEAAGSPDAARSMLRGYADVLATATGEDPQAIWEWGFAQRVATGLYVMGFGAHTLGRRFLASAEMLV